MKAVRAIDITHATPVDGRGHGRTPKVLLVLDKRNALLREAARRHCTGMSDRAAAKYLRDAISRYRNGRFRREGADQTCAPHHQGRLTELLWFILKVKDHVPSEMTVRRALGSRDPRDVIR